MQSKIAIPKSGSGKPEKQKETPLKKYIFSGVSPIP
jgi:hypothetical protein